MNCINLRAHCFRIADGPVLNEPLSAGDIEVACCGVRESYGRVTGRNRAIVYRSGCRCLRRASECRQLDPLIVGIRDFDNDIATGLRHRFYQGNFDIQQRIVAVADVLCVTNCKGSRSDGLLGINNIYHSCFR